MDIDQSLDDMIKKAPKKPRPNKKKAAAAKPEDKKPCVNRIQNDIVVVGNPLRGAPGSAVE